jgi:hypothetical protein
MPLSLAGLLLPEVPQMPARHARRSAEELMHRCPLIWIYEALVPPHHVRVLYSTASNITEFMYRSSHRLHINCPVLQISDCATRRGTSSPPTYNRHSLGSVGGR